jgi:hypothetical protein
MHILSGFVQKPDLGNRIESVGTGLIGLKELPVDFAEICLRRGQIRRFLEFVYFLLILRETGLQGGALVVY